MARTIEWNGDTYRIADKVGLAPLIRFAHVAKQGTDANDMEGLVAIHDLLEQCFAEKPYCSACGVSDPPEDCCPDRKVVDSEFDRWLDAATVARSGEDEMLEVVGLVVQALSARPTGQPSALPPGPPNTKPNTGADSVSQRVQERLEASGRPDLALALVRSQEAQAS